MNDKLLYRIPEVVAILNISRSKVYELLRDRPDWPRRWPSPHSATHPRLGTIDR